jgi:hypothetical protein
MAKLPTYEQRAPLMASIDTIQAPNLQEQMRRAKSIQGSLDAITKFAAGQAERGVKEKAAQYTVANPLTTQQLEESAVSGVNPIEAALNGGMVWNDAVKKLYADQASAELTNSAYKHYEDVYERVKNGQLTDAAIIQQQLETPLKSWSNVIAQIDPKSANAFYQRRITDGNSYYKASLKELRNKEQVRQDTISEDTMYGLIKQFEVDVQNQEPGVVFAKYINGQKEAEELFSSSTKQQQYKNTIEKQFTAALFRHLSSEFQGVYESSAEVMEAMQKGDLGKYSDIWQNLTPIQKNTLESSVNSDFSRIDAANKAKLKTVTDQGKDIQTAILNGDDPNNWRVEFNSYRDNAKNISGSLKSAADQDITNTSAVIEIADRFKYKSLPQIQQEIDMMRENPQLFPKSIVEFAEKHRDKLEAGRNKDLAEFAVKRHQGSYGDVNLFYGNDAEQLKASFSDQFGIISSHPDYKSGRTNLLTKTQTNELIGFLESDTGKLNKVQIASNIATVFPQDAISIFNSIAPKDPMFARMGALTIELGANDARPVLDKMMTGQSLIDNKQVGSKLKGARTSDTGVRITTALENVAPQNLDGIFAAADAYYVGMGGDTENNIDSKLYNQALQMVTGAVRDERGYQYGGFANINDDVVFIDSNVRADLVDDYMSTAKYNDFTSSRITDLTDDQMMQYSDNIDIVDPQGTPYSEVDLSRATLRQTTDGYVLIDENNQPFADQSGRQYLFDLNTLQEIYNNKMNPNLGQIDAKIIRSRYTETSDPRLRSNLPESEIKLKTKKGTGRGK